MSGKCDKCGAHPLECICPKHIPDLTDKFFFQSKFFKKEEEFWTYINDFISRQTTVEDFDGLFDMLKKDVWMNLSTRKTKISNGELRSILQETLIFILNKVMK